MEKLFFRLKRLFFWWTLRLGIMPKSFTFEVELRPYEGHDVTSCVDGSVLVQPSASRFYREA